MTTRREFLKTGATLVATGAVLTKGVTGCATPAAQAPDPPPDKAKLADDTREFVAVSALLTGLYDLLSNDPSDRDLNETMAKEYARRLRGTFPDGYAALLTAYKRLVAADARPKIDDALLKGFRATPEFMGNKLVADQIVNIWYLSRFKDGSGQFIDGGFYERGYVWPLIKAPPIGFSTKRPGYWSVEPAKEAN